MLQTVKLLALCLVLSMLLAMPSSSPAQKAPDKAPTGKKGKYQFPDLVGALKKTKGCLGVEVAKTASGKNVIFAWFKDKKALLRWYYSPTHRMVMKKFFPGPRSGKPLRNIPDNSGPIMAIASVTFAKKPKFKATPLPISQISIELYRPLSGGLYLGGRFAPPSLKVPKSKDYTPKKK